MKTFIVILLLLLSISYTQDSIGQNKATYIDSFIENKMAESGMVGVATAIVIDKKVAWSHGYGYADKDKNIIYSKYYHEYCLNK